MAKGQARNGNKTKQSKTSLHPKIEKKSKRSPSISSSNTVNDENERPLHYYLLKSEPDSRFENGIDMKFSVDDLKQRPNQTEHWDGVRNYQARNILKSMRLNDLAFFYHSNCKTPGIVGIMKVVKEYYPDHTQFDKTNPHYDPKSDLQDPKWGMVDVQFVRDLQRQITLHELKDFSESDQCPSAIKTLPLLSRSRLSCQSLTPQQWQSILDLESADKPS